jgi:hypothetical protein
MQAGRWNEAFTEVRAVAVGAAGPTALTRAQVLNTESPAMLAQLLVETPIRAVRPATVLCSVHTDC